MDTSHPFSPSKLNQSLCAVCYQDASRHGKVECESCTNTGILTSVKGVWLCSNCIEAEKQHIEYDSQGTVNGIPVINDANPISIPKSIELTQDDSGNSILKDHRPTDIENSAVNKLGQPALKSSEEFFNARTQSINDRWLEISQDNSITQENKHYQLAKEVRAHYLHFKEILIQAVEVQLECAANQRADQVYLNQLASKLREEERVKLHINAPDYIPPSIPKSAPKTPKVSKDDKIAADYARIMGIPIETARRLLANKLQEITGAKCTCQETPGICKVHK